MQADVVSTDFSEFSNSFPPGTLMFNETVMRLRMLAFQMSANQQTIDSVYSKISMGGLAAANSRLVGNLVDQVEALTGLCWSQIAAASSDKTQLEIEQWQDIGQSPPDWLRSIFEAATLMTGIPDEDSLAGLSDGRRVLVIRDPALARAGGLLPQAAALLPEGISEGDARIWWPWVMGGAMPVVLQSTDNPYVLRELTLAGLQALQDGDPD